MAYFSKSEGKHALNNEVLIPDKDINTGSWHILAQLPRLFSGSMLVSGSAPAQVTGKFPQTSENGPIDWAHRRENHLLTGHLLQGIGMIGPL